MPGARDGSTNDDAETSDASSHDTTTSRPDADRTLEIAQAPVADEERYVRRSRLGAGGMGVVYVCHDARLDRDIAMKVGSETVHLPRMNALIEREARIQGRLEHPAIVPVHDLGRSAEGDPFFTMRRIEGTSLRAVLKRLRGGDSEIAAAYGRRRLLAAFSTVCAAVAYAHSRGVLHRDIKPANVMLGEYGEVYLLDFGVARAADDVVPAGEVVGTPGFIAPEQARGESVDERADVYSLGAMLFEILTYEPLHSGTREQILFSTAGGADARASVRAPGTDVPPELEALCVRATANDPNDRFATARALREEVERFLDGDRDLERRRALADSHAKRARAAVMKSLKGGAERERRRDDALEEANRAIALDPTNANAMHVIAAVALLTEPGNEVDERERETRIAARRVLARTGIAIFAAWFAGLGAGALLGVRSWPAAIAVFSATVGAAAFVWLRTRSEAIPVRIGAAVACYVAAICISGAFGPLLLLPGFLACLGIVFSVATLRNAPDVSEPRWLRRMAVVAPVLSLFAPFVLEWTGVLPASMEIRDGAIVIVPRIIEFPPVATIALLLVANAILVVLPAIIVLRVRDYASEGERRALETASRLRQLLPRPAREATTGTLEDSR
jgi:serine/threonine-protein kinase